MSQTTYIARSKIHGKGLFAGSRIPAGTIIGWAETIPSDSDGPHVLWISECDAREVTCDLKYINHADDPNACYYDDLSVMALRDIQPHEEITHDYASNDW
jgi:SET domain-containing protein